MGLNQYLTIGAAIAIVVLGALLKSSYERNGELEASLKMQTDETLECAEANSTNQESLTTLESRIAAMIEERRVDTERREQVLVERSRELAAATARADRLEQEREDEQNENPDCADLSSLSLDMFCPATAHQLRQRTTGAGSDGDADGN